MKKSTTEPTREEKLQELKAMAYELILELNQRQNILAAVQKEIAALSKPDEPVVREG